MFDSDTTSKTASILSAPARSRTVQVVVFFTVLILAGMAGVVAIGQGVVSAVGLAQQSMLSSSGQPNTSCAVTTEGGAGTQVQASKLTTEQVGRAHVVWQVAHELGFGDQGAVVGMVTLAQESTWGADPKTHRPDSNVDVGPFQQRALPGWYASGKTVEENVRILSDIRYAARTFFTGYKVTAADHAAARANGTEPAGPVGYLTPGLASVKDWQSLPVTVAAQKVQRSAYPGHYAKHEGLAREMVAKFNAEGAPPAPSQAAVGSSPAASGPLCDPPGAVDAQQCAPTSLAAEKGLTPDGLRVLRCAHAQWPSLTIHGVRADPLPDHPSGRAVDIMVPGTCAPLGQQIADWAKTNAASLGVDYVIWCQKIWSVARDGEGWRAMGDRGSNTQNHGDHVHITVKGNAAGVRDQVPVSAEDGNATVVDPLENYSPSAWFGKPGKAWSSGYHTGLDFAAPAGTPIRAAKAGRCVASVWHGAYGNLLKIDHGDVQTWYAHLQSKSTCSGPVQAGTVIGNVGCTGNCFGAHLHLEVRRGATGSSGGKTEDPDAWLASQGVRVKGSRM